MMAPIVELGEELVGVVKVLQLVVHVGEQAFEVL